MNKKFSIEICNYYSNIDNDLIFINKNNQIEFFKEKIKIEGKFYSFSLINNLIWTYNNELCITEVYEYPKANKLYINKNYIGPRMDIYNPVSNDYLFCQVEINDTEYWALFNWGNKIIIKTYPLNYGLNGIWKILDNDTFLSIKDPFLACHSLSDGQELWRLDFNELLETKKAIQTGNLITTENYLFFYLYDESNFRKKSTFCVEILSGRVLKRFEGFGGWLTLQQEYIYVAHKTFIHRLHLPSHQIETLDFTQALAPFELEISWNNFVIENDDFYFMRSVALKPAQEVGLLDLKTRQLLWHTEIPIEEGSYWITNIQAHQNRFYVLTQGGTLHIFEKEE